MKRVLSLILVLMVGFSCSATPKLVPRLAYQKTPSLFELVRDSTVIVLATVASENVTGPTVTVGDNEHVRLQKRISMLKAS